MGLVVFWVLSIPCPLPGVAVAVAVAARERVRIACVIRASGSRPPDMAGILVRMLAEYCR